MSDFIYDSVYIGSSPCMMMEAHLSAVKGNKTCIIDKNTSMGGAWGVKNLFNMEKIESGPHFFQSESSILFFNQIYDIELEKKKKPIWIVSLKGMQFRINDKISHILLQILKFFNLSKILLSPKKRTESKSKGRNLSLFSYIPILKKVMHIIFFHKTSTHYFKYSCAQFVDSVFQKCIDAGVEFINDIANNVTIKSDIVALSLGGGNTIKTKKLFLTRRSILDTISINSKKHKMHTVLCKRKQVHFLVQSEEPIDIFLVRFIGMPLCIMTKLNNRKIVDNDIYLFALTFGEFYDTSEIHFDDEYFNVLIDSNVFPKTAKLIKSYHSCYEDNRMQENDYDFIGSLSDNNVFLIGDIDFSVWINQLKDKWHEKESLL